MYFRLLTAPAAPILTLEEAKTHLRIYHTDENAHVEALVASVADLIDGPTGILNRCVVSQQWEVTIDRFPENDMMGVVALKMPLPPLISIQSILYDDEDGVEQELTSGNYRIIGAESTSAAAILPLKDVEWPSVDDEPGSVRISFTAGYSTIPPGIKHAVKLLISHLNEHREENVDTGAKFGLLELPFGARNFLELHRYHP